MYGSRKEAWQLQVGALATRVGERGWSVYCMPNGSTECQYVDLTARELNSTPFESQATFESCLRQVCWQFVCFVSASASFEPPERSLPKFTKRAAKHSLSLSASLSCALSSLSLTACNLTSLGYQIYVLL